MDIFGFEYDPLELTAEQFEQEVRQFVARLGANLTEFKALHDQIITSPDGDYQIDVYVTFEAVGAEIKMLIECKKHSRPLERDVVQLLHGKLASLGAHKGIVFSTGGFQSGALRYAKEHGIACVHVKDGRAEYVQKSFGEPIVLPPWADPIVSHITWIEDKPDGNTILHYCSPESSTANDLLGIPRVDNSTGKEW